MDDVICLDPKYSTTRAVTQMVQPSFPLPTLGFKRLFRLPASSTRFGEGGLRLQGYNKSSGNEAARQPLITIITAVFNGEKTLEQSVLSVLKQSYDNIEYIVIDGGSSDGSLEILRQYEHAIDYWVSERDRGIYDAWNKGVALASGEWIAFLGADDLYVTGAIERYASFINQHPDPLLEFVSSRINLMRDSRCIRVVGAPWRWRVFRKFMGVAHVGAMHRRSLFEQFGLFDDSYKICGDYEFLLRSGAQLRAGFIDAVSVDMETGGVSDANIKVFSEAAKAKIFTAHRNFALSHIEKHWAILKWKLRNFLSR